MNKRKSPTLLLISSSIKSMTAKPKALLCGSAKDKLKFFGFALLFVYAFGVIAAMSGGMAYILCIAGAEEAVLPVMAMVTSMMVLLTALLNGSKALFVPRDYEFLMSLPVSKKSIAIANAVSSYLYDFLYIIIFFLPAAGVYAFMTRPGAMFYILLFPTVLLLPLIPFVIGGTVGIFISYISSRIKNKNLATVVLNLLLVIIIFGVSSVSGALAEDEEMIVSIVSAFSAKVRYVYFPAELCGAGLGGNIVLWLTFVAISVLPTLVFLYFAAKYYRQIHDFMTFVPVGGKKTKKTKKTPISAKEEKSSISKILLKREFKRYFSIPAYVVNTIIGPILIILIAVVFTFVPITTLFEAEAEDAMSAAEFMNFMYSLLPSLLVFPVTMTTTAASSVSLEGESRYILKSSPLKKKDIYGAKILLNLLLLMPAVLIAWIMLSVRGIIAQTSVYSIISILLLPSAFSVFVSVFGLWCNLKHQKYDWKSEIEVVKQSTAVMIVVFLGMAISIGAILLSTLAGLASELFSFGINVLLTAVILLFSLLFWCLSLKNEIK